MLVDRIVLSSVGASFISSIRDHLLGCYVEEETHQHSVRCRSYRCDLCRVGLVHGVGNWLAMEYVGTRFGINTIYWFTSSGHYLVWGKSMKCGTLSYAPRREYTLQCQNLNGIIELTPIPKR